MQSSRMQGIYHPQPNSVHQHHEFGQGHADGEPTWQVLRRRGRSVNKAQDPCMLLHDAACFIVVGQNEGVLEEPQPMKMECKVLHKIQLLLDVLLPLVGETEGCHDDFLLRCCQKRCY